jgi:hypothetical protein
VLWQPGAASPTQPWLLDASDGPQSPSAQLVRTAERALLEQTGRSAQSESLFGELARLALPSGLGEQAVLIEHGIDAVGLSSAGERPIPVAADQPDDLSEATLGDFGRAALVLAATLDAAPAPPEHGPDAYLTLAGNLVPGWTLALLALTLLAPPAVTAFDSLMRGARRGASVGPALRWAGSLALPLVAAVLATYLFALIGIIARPTFPFDPGRFRVGAGQMVAIVFLGAVILAGYRAMRAWRMPAGVPIEVAAPALGLVSALAVLLAWLANPYLALLLVPAAHVWLLEARRGAVHRPLIVIVIALSLAPLVAAGANVASRLDLGWGAPWQLVLVVGDGQMGFVPAMALCLLVGCMVGLAVVAFRSRRPGPGRSQPPEGVPTTRVEPPRRPVVAPARQGLDASRIPPERQADDLAGDV